MPSLRKGKNAATNITNGKITNDLLRMYPIGTLLKRINMKMSEKYAANSGSLSGRVRMTKNI